MSSRQWDALEADYRPPHPASEGTCVSRQSGGTPKHGPCLLHAYFPDAALKLRRAVLGSRRAEGLAWLCGPREDEHSTAQRIKPARVGGGGAACVWAFSEGLSSGQWLGVGWGGTAGCVPGLVVALAKLTLSLPSSFGGCHPASQGGRATLLVNKSWARTGAPPAEKLPLVFAAVSWVLSPA